VSDKKEVWIPRDLENERLYYTVSTIIPNPILLIVSGSIRLSMDPDTNFNVKTVVAL
jgi:hypothetical protein